MEVSESIVCLELHFDCQVSGPLAQGSLPSKSVVETTTSYDLVFSSDRSGDRFTGKPVSQTTGLYYYFQRWYDSITGRFIGQDPLTGSVSDPQSQNRYVYVRNQPTSLVDPSGMEYRSDCVGGAYVCEGGVGSPGADTSRNMSDTFRQRICGQNPWICGLTGLGVGGIGLGTTADWVCGQNPWICDPYSPKPDGTTRSPGSGEGVKPTAPTITVYPGAIRIPVATNPSGSYGSTSTIFGDRGALSEMAPPGRSPRTPGEDPSGPGNEKIPRGDQGGASPPWALLCGGAAIAGLVAGGIAYAGTQNSRLDYPAEGVAGGIFLCVVAYAKWH